MALALNFEPCFTPIESPESNGTAEAFVNTFKRDYVRVNPIPDAAIAIAAIWSEVSQRTLGRGIRGHRHLDLGQGVRRHGRYSMIPNR